MSAADTITFELKM